MQSSMVKEPWRPCTYGPNPRPSVLDSPSWDAAGRNGLRKASFSHPLPRPVGSQNHSAVMAYISQALTDDCRFLEYNSFQQDTPLGMQTFTYKYHGTYQSQQSTPDGRVSTALLLLENVKRQGIQQYINHFMSIKDATVRPYTSRRTSLVPSTLVPCAMLLHPATAMTGIFWAQNVVNNELSVTLLFFGGEDAFHSLTSGDKLWLECHPLHGRWLGFSSDRAGQLYLDRMNVLFLLDLVEATEPNFIKVLVCFLVFFSQISASSCRTCLDKPGQFGEPPTMTKTEDSIANNFPIVTQPLFHGYNPSEHENERIKQSWMCQMSLVLSAGYGP